MWNFGKMLGLALAIMGTFCSSLNGTELAASKVLCNFDQEALSGGWAIVGKAQAWRGTPPDTSNDPDGPHGASVCLKSAGLGGIVTKNGPLSQDWERVEEVSLWLWQPYERLLADQAPTMEIQFIEGDGRTRFWQKIVVDHHGWKEYHLPLCWFRWSPGRVPVWAHVRSICLLLTGKGEVWVDNIAVREGEAGTGAALTSAKLAPVAFPDVLPTGLKTSQTNRVLVMTDVPDLDVSVLCEHLELVVSTLQKDIPSIRQTNAQGILVVFRNRQEYLDFLPRLATTLNAQANYQPPGGGYTTHKIATSFWDAKQGTLRPVFAHEFLHSYIESAMLLPCINEWFQEGIANSYQMRLHPQVGMAQMLKRALDTPAHQVPLPKLCDGTRIEMRSYWQAATLVDLLIRSPKYQKALPKLVTAFQTTGSTNLAPHIESILETNWDTLKRDWAEYTLETFCK